MQICNMSEKKKHEKYTQWYKKFSYYNVLSTFIVLVSMCEMPFVAKKGRKYFC